jgi:hypothetical protein
MKKTKNFEGCLKTLTKMSDGEYSLICKSIKKGKPIFVDKKKIIHGQTIFIVTKND